MTAGNKQTFTASVTGGVGAKSYQWYLDGTIVSGQTSSTYEYTASVTGSPHTVYVKVTDSATPPVSLDSNSVTITVNAATVAIQFRQNGAGSDATQAIVTIDSVTYTYAQLQTLSFNWVPGTTHSISASTTVAAGTGKQYAWTSWSIGGSASQTYTTPNSAATVTANYKTQYQCSFGAGNIGTGYTGTVLTVGSTTYTSLPQNNLWVDSGTTYSYTGTVPAGTGKQYVLTGTTGLATPIITSGTATPTYKTQYYVTFEVSPSGSGTTTASGWFDGGVSGQAISASPNSGYTFSAWSNPSGSVTFASSGSASTTMTVNSASTVRATFTVQDHYIDTSTQGLHNTAQRGTITNFNNMQDGDSDFGTITESSSTDGRRADIQMQFTSVSNYASYTALEIKTGTGSYGSPGENLNVYYWSGSQWVSLGTMSQSSYTYTFTVALSSSSFDIRFVDSNTGSDSNTSSWNIEFVRLSA
ncbi:MAG: hypothetical protein NWE96_11330 [Candidatus Bathyarchaeota archaeon]|nr:hypothetical protein [Candidatus Bathyarchaeota archaeon]